MRGQAGGSAVSVEGEVVRGLAVDVESDGANKGVYLWTCRVRGRSRDLSVDVKGEERTGA